MRKVTVPGVSLRLAQRLGRLLQNPLTLCKYQAPPNGQTPLPDISAGHNYSTITHRAATMPVSLTTTLALTLFLLAHTLFLLPLSESLCTSPSWQTAYSYTNGDPCPSGWALEHVPAPLGLPDTPNFPQPLTPGTTIGVCIKPDLHVTVKSETGDTADFEAIVAPAVLVEGWEYEKIRGRVG